MKLMLNMIVRNESARIERALASAAPYINSWVIVDTGSTDDTKDRIVAFFKERGIPGEIRDVPFIDFGQARNAGLFWARSLAPFYQPDYFMLMDADMEFVVREPAVLDALLSRHAVCVEAYQQAGAVQYTNARFLASVGDFKYLGVTHEYLDAPVQERVPMDVAYFKDHADGSNRLDKYKRDIRLLRQGLKDEPNNVRYMFYLACSYRDAGKPIEAAKWFQRRVKAGGWDEEVWQAQLGYACALKDLGDEPGFIREMLIAYNMRPTRAETMYDLSKYLREHGNPVAALACAEAVEHLPKPNDVLFVNDFVYAVGIKDEIAISSFYAPGKMDKGRRVNDEVVLARTNYGTAARANTFWYVRPLGELAPSFEWQVIPFTPPDNLVPLNPSVVLWHDNLWCNVRAVNYRIDENGAYLIRGTDGTANRENPIDTRNFLLDLGTGAPWLTPPVSWECYRPGNMPVEFPLVTGFEDMRLYVRDHRLMFSATVRQLAADGQCEQVRGLLLPSPGRPGYDVCDMSRMLREPRVTEKNWSPIVGPGGLFVHRPGIVVDSDGKEVMDSPVPVATDHLSGSSQTIPFEKGWLSVVHTAHALPGCDYKRYYYHRFIHYAADFTITDISLPFVFHDKVIEFCAGMCWHPRDDTKLVLSYGFKDEEARIATISRDDVKRLLAEGHHYEYP